MHVRAHTHRRRLGVVARAAVAIRIVAAGVTTPVAAASASTGPAHGLHLVVLGLELGERGHVRDGVDELRELVHDVLHHALDVLDVDPVHHLQHRRVHEAVAPVGGDEHLEDGRQQVVLDNVPVIELVLHGEARAHEADASQDEVLVAVAEQPEHLGQQVVAQDEVLDTVRVRLHAERQQVDDVALDSLGGSRLATPRRGTARRAVLAAHRHERRHEPRYVVVVEDAQELVLLRRLHRVGVQQQPQQLARAGLHAGVG
mmetsp:Transcript_20633/g.72857  ORF Transcript_20633/g.72857 Transcript_20633/m.72857 type:complete len:258 (+) Transcript_20633:404-1177(+)